MNREKVIIPSLILSMLLLALTYGAVVRATPEEKRTVYAMEYFLGLRVSIEAPYQVDPGENITVTVKAEASGDVYVEYIYVNIYGLKNETEEILLADIMHVEASHLTVPRELDYVVTIPNDTSSGLTYGIVRWKWTYMGVTITPPPAGFIVTYVKNREFEQLQEMYNTLNETYNSLLGNQTELESKYKGELGTTRNLMYIFVATTVVSAATAFLLLMRRPKTLWT